MREGSPFMPASSVGYRQVLQHPALHGGQAGRTSGIHGLSPFTLSSSASGFSDEVGSVNVDRLDCHFGRASATASVPGIQHECNTLIAKGFFIGTDIE
jgi:hypothetical protein